MTFKNRKIAFVTPSYFKDFERCKLLTDSTSRFLSQDMEHILIIDRRDIELFKPLENEIVRIVEAESLVPWWIFRVPTIKNWWLSLKSLPIRNWMYQQFLKIFAVHATDADIIQFIDSDVTLTRPFPMDYLFKDEKVRLQKVAFNSIEHAKWIRIAGKLLGISEKLDINYNYIGSFITWTRPNILDMIERIKSVNSGNPYTAIANKLHFSEYMTYGVFIDYVKGLENSGHFYDDSPNLHLCWGYDLKTADGIDAFFKSIKPENFGVMIHSKDAIPISSYRKHIENLWSQY